MKILYYCQHVLGIGHFFRSLEICRALKDHRVIMVSGGEPVKTGLPAHVQTISLPPIMMDSNFRQFLPGHEHGGIEAVKTIRRNRLLEVYESEKPDCLIIELYPFGRKAFRFELDPLLMRIHADHPRRCRVVCSLRDILVEKTDVAAYEDRVVQILNQWFDAVLIHADSRLVQLNETFSRIADIRPSLIYTGFVTPRPEPRDRGRIRNDIGLTEADRLIVVSAGGGKVGMKLLHAATQAFLACQCELNQNRMQVFTGPFLDEPDFDALLCNKVPRLEISRFTPDFPAWLAAADLSISMAGYNTCMDILSARIKALVYPFRQNREQSLRATRLEQAGFQNTSDAWLQ